MFLRNLLIIEKNEASYFGRFVRKQFSTTNIKMKTVIDSKFQGKVFNKLYGKRLVGQKKRFIPAHNSTHNKNELFFNDVNISSKKMEPTKSNQRRIAMLNKLFMEHISSLLALGIVSDKVLNKGLQITRVRVSIDYSCINVYWICSENSLVVAELEKELQRCSGLLRHELSQLEIMGSVPRINFVSDRLNKHIMQVEETLKKLKPFSDELDAEETSTSLIDFCITSTKTAAGEQQFTEMSQDVFDLNRDKILLKIVNKMRTSKQAWQLYNKDLNAVKKDTPEN